MCNVPIVSYLRLCRRWCVRVLRRLLTLLWSLGDSRDGGARRRPPGPILYPCSLITQSCFEPLQTTKRQSTVQAVQSSGKVSRTREDDSACAGRILHETLRPLEKKREKKQQQDDKISPAWLQNAGYTQMAKMSHC